MPNRFERHPKLTILFVIFLSFVCLEIGVRVAVSLGVLEIEIHPTSEKPLFWNDINEAFGVWHYPNATFKHEKNCFEVTYHTNSYGARDTEREKAYAGRRFVVLGDSFTEGYGVTSEERFTDILEKQTGVPFLNFGTSGQFGTVQQYMLYKTMASDFEHTDVAIFFLPANDFTDVDPDFFSGPKYRFSKRRYRPYLTKGDDGEYTVTYTTSFDPNRSSSGRPLSKRIVNHISNNWWTHNVIRKSIRTVKHKESNKKYDKPASVGYYDHFKQKQADIVIESLKRIAELAGDRRIWLFVIPTRSDFESHLSRNLKGEAVSLLKGFSGNYDNIQTVDLLPHFLKHMETADFGQDPSPFFHTCDGHWSPLSNKLVADVVRKTVWEIEN